MNHDDIINKIKAIMRLARRAGTDGERIAAESAAKRLADKNGIALVDLEITDSSITSVYEDSQETYVTHKTEIGYITAVLRQHFGVIPVQHSLDGGRRVRFSWIGTKINIAIAQHVYAMLIRECRAAWGRVRLEKKRFARLDPVHLAMERHLAVIRNLNQRSFYDGWFSVIHRKLAEHPLRADLEQFAAEKRSAEEMFEQLKQKLDIADKQSKSSATDRTSCVLGMNAAEEINLSHPVNADGSYRPQPKLEAINP